MPKRAGATRKAPPPRRAPRAAVRRNQARRRRRKRNPPLLLVPPERALSRSHHPRRPAKLLRHQSLQRLRPPLKPPTRLPPSKPTTTTTTTAVAAEPPKPVTYNPAPRPITQEYDDAVKTVLVNYGSTTNINSEVVVDFSEAHGQPFDLSKSDYLTHIVEQVNAGHSGAVLSLCGDGNVANIKYTEAVVMAMATNLMTKLETAARENQERFNVYMTGATFPVSNRDINANKKFVRKDLFAPLGFVKAAQFGVNPVYGSRLVNLTEKGIKNTNDVRSKITHCVKGFQPKKDEMLVMQLFFTQIRTPLDIYVSSIMFVFINHLQPTFQLANLLSNISSKQKEGPLFATPLGGSSRTAVFIPLTDAEIGNPESVKKTFLAVADLAKVQNKPPRSGNVTQFVNHGKASLLAGSYGGADARKVLEGGIAAAEKTLKNPEKIKFGAVAVN
ncbi:hypothetical protein, conserved [Angomonas deanei]|uniref:Uncharacterized protein n=1 Tax=Angomonas deanei TaxID=59799 RepID=A0A7G2C261_9TRYP|nr:hypothetical protein, conserved [Angomonas deanei]